MAKQLTKKQKLAGFGGHRVMELAKKGSSRYSAKSSKKKSTSKKTASKKKTTAKKSSSNSALQTILAALAGGAAGYGVRTLQDYVTSNPNIPTAVKNTIAAAVTKVTGQPAPAAGGAAVTTVPKPTTGQNDNSYDVPPPTQQIQWEDMTIGEQMNTEASTPEALAAAEANAATNPELIAAAQGRQDFWTSMYF